MINILLYVLAYIGLASLSLIAYVWHCFRADRAARAAARADIAANGIHSPHYWQHYWHQ